MSGRRTLLWVPRHGTTDDNEKNIFRGQRNSSLDRKGFRDAHELHDFFADKDWHWIFSSDLHRAVQTAKIIAGDRKEEIVPPHKGLRPRDIGYLTGKSKEDHGHDMQVFLDHPDKAPQGGESSNEFERERIWPLFCEAIEMGEKGKPPIMVSHSSGIHSLAHLLYGAKHKELAVKPGGAIEVYLEDGEIKARAVLKPGRDDSSFSTKKIPPSS